MDNVPNIISTKDLSYISDMLNWIHVISKKINHYTNIVEDEDLLNLLENINDLLINHYNNLLEALN